MIQLPLTDYGFLIVKQGLYKLLKARNDSLKNAIKRNDLSLIERRKIEISDIRIFIDVIDNYK